MYFNGNLSNYVSLLVKSNHDKIDLSIYYSYKVEFHQTLKRRIIWNNNKNFKENTNKGTNTVSPLSFVWSLNLSFLYVLTIDHT